MRFPLHRYYEDERQTLGMIGVGAKTLFTIERPWVHNQPFNSRFTDGTLKMKAIEIEGKRKVRLERATGVRQERTLLNIEVANWASELHGCVGIGLGVSFSRADPDSGRPTYQVTSSKTALAHLLAEMDRWPDVPMYLDVIDGFPDYTRFPR